MFSDDLNPAYLGSHADLSAARSDSEPEVGAIDLYEREILSKFQT